MRRHDQRAGFNCPRVVAPSLGFCPASLTGLARAFGTPTPFGSWAELTLTADGSNPLTSETLLIPAAVVKNSVGNSNAAGTAFVSAGGSRPSLGRGILGAGKLGGLIGRRLR